MASLYRALGLRLALGSLLWAIGCQHDSNADFDDSDLMSPDVGGSGNVSGSSAAAAGEDPGTSGATGGTEASAGGPSNAGKSSGGSGGGPAGGSGGGPSAGGKSGGDTGGSTGQAGKAAQGGSAGAVNGGTAGSTMAPEPVTIEYSDIDDTSVSACTPSLMAGAEPSLHVDGDSCAYETLIDFPRLELPTGAEVSDATLTLTCTNAGDPITVSYADGPWKELMVRWSTRPEVGETLDTVTCDEPGELTIDLTEAFQAWVAGDHSRDGIYLRTEDSDGTDFDSSEAPKASTRPRLSLTYTLPAK